MKPMKSIPISRWSKDHWSMLGYVATCFDGVLDRRRMRCNKKRHPLLNNDSTQPWKNEHGTRIKLPVETVGPHDDWDCLDDLEAAGFVEIISTINAFVKLTELGNQVAFKLREHKQSGGNFAGFEYSKKALTK